jgi:hypothetical protein
LAITAVSLLGLFVLSLLRKQTVPRFQALRQVEA